MECKHQFARRGDSWGGSTTTTSSTLHDSQAKKSLEETRFRERVPEMFSTSIFEKNNQCGVKVKPGLTSCQMERKTNLSRSASLSEKELKEARAKSQIIAAQLQADSNSKGVQLFNRRRQRVNAFTLVSIGGQRENVIDSSSGRPLALDKYNSVETQQSKTGFSGSAAGLYRCPAEMDETGDTAHEDVADAIREERHFLPVNEKDEEVSVDLMEDLKDEFIASDNRIAVLDRACQDDPEANGTHSTSIDTNKEDIVNGYSMQLNGTVANAETKQTSTINRTARPFFSPTTVEQSDSTNPARYIPPAPSYKFPEPPTTAHSNPEPYNKQNYPFPQPTRQSFSPPPPPPSYPTPPLPLPPPSAPVNTSSDQTSSCYIRPSEPRPTFVSELLNEQRSVTPIRTGILDEGRVRRSSRKSMFTFQEKPKLAPNPELLSLVQGADEKKKHKTQPEPALEEELLALGAEASNFLPKEEGVHEEALVPEWASSLKSSRTRARMEHKPEQALTNASGKGAELFAKRQSRMERYDKEQVRSPSPTMSLPPSWIYPSNMPGRVKAIVNTSNISAQITKSLHAQQATQKKATSKMQASVPPPAPEVPLENGCTKIEMELSKHQPYQINSSLFILNPSKDPYCTLPRAAKSGYTIQTSLPTSPLPSPYTPSATLRSSHCFSPPMTPLCPVSAGPISSPIPPSQERVVSPRSVVHVPRPSFSAKKAGITPQKNPETQAANSNPVSTAPPFITHNLSRRYTSPDVTSSNVWSIGSQLVTPSSSSSSNHIYKPTPISPSSQPIHKTIMTYSSPSPSPKPAASPGSIFKPATTSPVSPSWDSRCQSPAVTQDIKANHRILAKNIINAAKRKNSPSPSSSRSLPISPVSPSIVPYEHKSLSPFQPRMLGAQTPTIISPSPTRLIPSPVRLYNTRSLTDSDASVESEDSGLRSPGARSYNTCPRGWTGGLQVKKGSVPEDL